MKVNTVLLIFALSTLALAGILPEFLFAPNPNDIWKKVQFRPINALEYADPQVEVDSSTITFGTHGIALNKIRILYPDYALIPVWRCRYSTLGLVRFYTFSFKVNFQIKEAKTAVGVDQESEKSDNSDDEKDGFIRISIEWAEQDPRISLALKTVINDNFDSIKARPLVGCWAKPIGGVHIYRFYFKGVVNYVEYHEGSSSSVKKTSESLSDLTPILDVQNSEDPEKYVKLVREQILKHPALPTIRKLLNKQLGFFNDDWIGSFEGVSGKADKSLKLVINFKPFLLKQQYEAYYYGDIEKASLLKIDEQVFNEGTSYEKWQEIQDFDKFHAFHEAHQYILTQFTWLRFYKVVSAYTACHKRGRFVRLAFLGLGDSVNMDAGNQLNMVIFIDEKGEYFLDRNDFHATHLNSYGRNDWVSLFIATPDMTKAKFYQKTVNFFKDIYPKFWQSNQLVDIKFKDNLHVIKFKNPTNTHHSVLLIDDKDTKVLNKISWIALQGDSPLIGRIENLVRGKYQDCSKIMFIQYLKNENGTHFQISYLSSKQEYRAVYLRYIEATDVFADCHIYSFNPQGINVLPEDVQASIIDFLQHKDQELLAVASFVSLSQTSFAVIAIGRNGRWQIIIEWHDGKWVVVSKQPYNDGYYKAHGYPSALAASATGFVKKLHPKKFESAFVYASIETKNIGTTIFIRLVYKLKEDFIEVIVKKIFGVQNSHVLYSWNVIKGLKVLPDYGYGVEYLYGYNLDKALLFEDQKKEGNLSQEGPEEQNKQSEGASQGNSEESEPTEISIEAIKPKKCPAGTRPAYSGIGCIVVF